MDSVTGRVLRNASSICTPTHLRSPDQRADGNIIRYNFNYDECYILHIIRKENNRSLWKPASIVLGDVVCHLILEFWRLILEPLHISREI